MGMTKGLFSDGKGIAPNPDPKRFKIRQWWINGDYVLVTVHYPGCTTFEGNKLLVFKGQWEEIDARTELDPHFTEGSGIVARFPATEEGWFDAVAFCRMKEGAA